MADSETLDGGWAPTREEAMQAIARHAVPGEKVLEIDEMMAMAIRQEIAEGSLAVLARVVLLTPNTVIWDQDFGPILLGWSWSRIIKSEQTP